MTSEIKHYMCLLTLHDLSGVITNVISEAVIESSAGLNAELIVQASITLTCTVASGARSLDWLVYILTLLLLTAEKHSGPS